MSLLQVVAVPAFTDNYLWLVHDNASGETAVIDPGAAAPVLTEADRRGWRIGQVLNTHWHADHTGGNLAIKAIGARVSGPAAEADRIPGLDVPLKDGDTVSIGGHVGEVWEVAGHTLGHIAFIFRSAGIAFVGDTLFAMGCGRLFEGSPDQMFASLRRLASLPAETLVYCAHEYTLSNARFAAHAEPANRAVADRLAEVTRARENGLMTVPTTIALEIATNPFLLASSVEQFAERRTAKDGFR